MIWPFNRSFFAALRLRKSAAPSVMSNHAQMYCDESTGALKVILPDGSTVDLSTAIEGPLVFKGPYDASTNTPDLVTPAAGAVKSGYTYKVSAAGAFFTANLEIGDMLIAISDDPSALANWMIAEKDLEGAVTAAAALTADKFTYGDGGTALKATAYDASSFDAAGSAAAAQAAAIAASVPKATGTAKGGIVGFSAAATPAEIGPATFPADEGKILVARAAQGSGFAFEAPSVTVPGGADTQLQYNNSGAFGGLSDVTVGAGTLAIASTRKLLPSGSGANSVSLGNVNSSQGPNGVVIGTGAKIPGAYFYQAVAVGFNAYSKGFSTTLGAGAVADGGLDPSGGVAVGYGASATGNKYAIAINKATSTGGIALGYGASAAYGVFCFNPGGPNAEFTKPIAGTLTFNATQITRLKHGSNHLVESVGSTGSTTTANGTLSVVVDGTTYYLLTAASA